MALDVKAGDTILFGKYSGQEIKLDGVEYLIMKEDDVLRESLDGSGQGESKWPIRLHTAMRRARRSSGRQQPRRTP